MRQFQMYCRRDPVTQRKIEVEELPELLEVIVQRVFNAQEPNLMTFRSQPLKEWLAQNWRGDERVKRLEQALCECAQASSEEMLDGLRPPTCPPIEEWAVQCVKQLREDSECD